MKEICGDNFGENKLTIGNRVKYLLLNFFRGINGYRKRLKSKYWTPIKFIANSSSPSRQYIDNFLMHKFPEIFPRKEIKVLDIGCGSGYVREILNKLGYEVDYTGVDVYRHEQFDDFNRFCVKPRFIQSEIENLDLDEKYDLIISISALEHIKDDKLAVEKSERLLNPGGVVIHIVPSFWALFLYLWHGYRQYTPALINKLFANRDITAYRLGGFLSFGAHWALITIPEFFSSQNIRQTGFYKNYIYFSAKFDKFLPVGSTIWAIVYKYGNNKNI
ncbi:MAG: class I SAM-dependent methyltransferase [Patescibacteria group bacterium]